MKQIETHRCYDGYLSVWQHESTALKCNMRFSVYLPDKAQESPVPLITFLSGLTCTHENFTTKAGAYKKASELGMAILAPDTSPRGEDVPDEPESSSFGKGAGFYVNATQHPWSTHYHMADYITDELYTLIPQTFPVLGDCQSLMGHSMGGHGALSLFLKYPHKYRSVSAFAPIVSVTQSPTGQNALRHYLGADEQEWYAYDACQLVLFSPQKKNLILIDQGLDDEFLHTSLKPSLFQEACRTAGQPLTLRFHQGFDHGYYFIQTFIDDHLEHHFKMMTA
jgi:S-formylglutathione hydrolase